MNSISASVINTHSTNSIMEPMVNSPNELLYCSMSFQLNSAIDYLIPLLHYPKETTKRHNHPSEICHTKKRSEPTTNDLPHASDHFSSSKNPFVCDWHKNIILFTFIGFKNDSWFSSQIRIYLSIYMTWPIRFREDQMALGLGTARHRFS